MQKSALANQVFRKRAFPLYTIKPADAPRNTMLRLPACTLLAALALHRAHAAAPVATGLLAHLLGTWSIHGTTRGRPTTTGAEITPQFGGAFIEMHIKDPAGRSPYEARVFFGQAADGDLVIHWLDRTGGETSRTLGSGHIVADSLVFSFPYPDGTFRDRLSFDPAHDTWRLRIETGPAGQPVTFSDWYFDRIKAR